MGFFSTISRAFRRDDVLPGDSYVVLLVFAEVNPSSYDYNRMPHAKIAILKALHKALQSSGRWPFTDVLMGGEGWLNLEGAGALAYILRTPDVAISQLGSPLSALETGFRCCWASILLPLGRAEAEEMHETLTAAIPEHFKGTLLCEQATRSDAATLFAALDLRVRKLVEGPNAIGWSLTEQELRQTGFESSEV